MQPEISSSSDNTAVLELLDALIVGDMHWPCASDALNHSLRFTDLLLPEERAWLFHQARSLQKVDEGERRHCIGALERTDQQRFRRILEALYRAYYTSPKVVARVHSLAGAGPPDPSATFDPSLLDRVV